MLYWYLWHTALTRAQLRAALELLEETLSESIAAAFRSVSFSALLLI
jgi:hypothetical protein